MTRLRIHRVVLPCSRCALLIQLCAPSSSYVPFLPLLFSSYCAPILLMCSSLITVLPSSRCAPSHCTPLLLLCSPPAVLPSSQCAPLFPLCPLPLYFPTPVVLLSGCDPLLRCALLLLCSQDTSGCPIAGDTKWPWRTCSPFLASLCPHYPASDNLDSFNCFSILIWYLSSDIGLCLLRFWFVEPGPVEYNFLTGR